MHTTIISSAFVLAKRFYSTVLREVRLSSQFIGCDYAATWLPALIFLVAAWLSHSGSPGELLLALGRGALYFFLYSVSFVISNQIVGIEEDRLNKPERPLVTGAVSLEGAKVRWAVSMVLYSLAGWWFGVLEWTLLWQACIIVHNFGNGDKYWLTKNLIIGVGALAELAAAWQLVTPLTPDAWRWIFVLAGVWSTLVAVQDLRDIEGDRAIGRNTFPLVFGETASRVMLTLGFAILPLVTHFVLFVPAGDTWNAIACDAVLAIISLILAARIVTYRSPKADQNTYVLFTYWYCFALFSAVAAGVS